MGSSGFRQLSAASLPSHIIAVLRSHLSRKVSRARLHSSMPLRLSKNRRIVAQTTFLNRYYSILYLIAKRFILILMFRIRFFIISATKHTR